MNRPPLSLYVHLPWCERKCPYCDFNSHEREDIPEATYVDALLVDLREELRRESRPLQTIFIGGGTPSLFSVESIRRLMQGIAAHAECAEGMEVTMEANPGSVESDRLAGYAAAGVNRFSLGVQSFDDACLQKLGRVHDSRSAAAAIKAARASGVASFNIDLMHGLPDQTLAQGLNDIERAIQASAPHISWYQLTIEPNTQFFKRPPRLPAEELMGELESAGTRRLTEAGYERYEVSAWAKPGERCRHNLNYWNFGDYIAIGAGAHGKLTANDGSIERYAKTRNPDDYLAASGTERRSRRLLSDADRCGEFMLNALRLEEGFFLKSFEERTGLDVARIKPLLSELEEAELLNLEQGRVRTTGLGRRFLDDVVGRFFDET
ncbi:MAG: radical SAM family heme chaperone HemW [Congregibacter sp.]